MSTIFEQPTSSGFALKNKAGGGGIKRIKKTEGPTNFYQQIEYNAERLLLNFPSKDKLQLMKLLEELDNQVEVAHEILTSEMSSSSQSSVNSAFKSQEYPYNNEYTQCQMSNQYNFRNQTNENNMMGQMMGSDANKFETQQGNGIKERRILKNLKPKQINKDISQGLKGQQQQQNQNQIQLGGVNMQMCQQQNQPLVNNINFNTIQMEDSLANDRQGLQLKSQMSYGMAGSMNQLESKISQETPSNQADNYQRQAALQNQKQQQQQQELRQDNNDEDEQQSAPQEDDSQSIQSQPSSSEQSGHRSQEQQYNQQQQQQQIQSQPTRIKDLNQIEDYQKQLVDNIIPQLLQQLKNSSIDVAPDIILQAFKYYEEQNRRATQYDKIISTHEQVLKGLSNILRKKQQLEKRVEELQKENQKISEERDKYRNTSERYKIMFQNNNQYQQQSQGYYYNNYFDKGGDSGMCF